MSVFVTVYAEKNYLNRSVGPVVHDTASVFLLAVSRALNWLATIYSSKYLCIYSMINILQMKDKENSNCVLVYKLEQL